MAAARFPAGSAFGWIVLILCGSMPALCGAARADGNLRIPINDAGVFDPAQGPATVHYQLLKDATEVVVQIRDIKGQVVKEYRFIALLAGDQEMAWDGTDENGERLPDGRYEFWFDARFQDGSRSQGLVTARIASIGPAPQAPAPEPPPPEKHPYKISGSLLTFARRNGEDNDYSGQLRLRTRFTYADESRRVVGLLALIDTYPDGDANWDASQAFIEKKWGDGRLKGVFRESLGTFDDPIKLFSDFKSERKKIGLRVDQGLDALEAVGLAYTTENDAGADGTAAAARLRWGKTDGWSLGGGFTYHQAQQTAGSGHHRRNQASAMDLRVPLGETLALHLEFVHTEDSQHNGDNGYTAIATYDQGRLRLSGGYIDLGQDFAADFADPLHGVAGDARGIEAGLDYSLPAGWRYFRSPYFTARVFDLRRQSDHSNIREADAAFRFGLGARSTALVNWYGQDNQNGTTHTLLGTLMHQWNARYASSLQVNRIVAHDSGTWRCTLDTAFTRKPDSARAALEWIRRENDDDTRSPYQEINLRLDWRNALWGLQLQPRYSRHNGESGYNFFGRVEYRPVFLHRYHLTAYASLGNRASFDYEDQVEVGVELRF